MSSISFWTERLRPHIIDTVLSRPMLAEITKIQFVRHFDQPCEGTLYVGMPDEIERVLTSEAAIFGLTFFSAGQVCGLKEAAQQRGVNLVCVQMDALDIYECVSVVLQQYRHWTITLASAAVGRHSIQDIVKAGAALGGADLFLLNTANRVIYAATCANVKSALTGELLAMGCLSPATVQRLEVPLIGGEPIRQLAEEGNICWIYSAKKDSLIISTMLMFVPVERSRIDAQTLLSSIKTIISRMLSSTEQDIHYWAGTDFKAIMDDILMQRVCDDDEINQRFAALTTTPQLFCSIVVIELPADSRSVSTHMLTQLEIYFPASNIALYDHTIIILLSRPDRDFQPFPIFDESGFNALLSQHNAHAAISNATSKRSMLRTELLLAQSTLQIAKALSLQLSRRIYFFEDFADYVLIDLCITSFQSLLGHDDLIMLTHPDVVKLYRYDIKHQETLLDVLYYYCLNNLSIAKTAQSAYMHRNTVTAKVKRIGELIRADLTNGQIQQRLIFSYKILRYCERYAKIDIIQRLSEQ